MAITLSAAAQTAAKNAAANAVADLFDAGVGSSGGKIVLKTAAAGVVATCIGSNPFFGAAAAGVCSQSGTAVDNNAAGSASAVTNFSGQDRDGTEILAGSVAESGADLNIDDGTVGGGVVINAGAVVTISSIQLTFSLV